MFGCAHCDDSCESNKLLYNHIVKVHSESVNFRCIFENCPRIYKNCKSFKAHVKSKHASCIADNATETIKETPVVHTPEIQSDHFKNSNSDEYEIYYSSDSDFDDFDHEEMIDDTCYDDLTIPYENAPIISEWETNIENACLKYTASLYNIKSISRKVVDEVVRETKELLKVTSQIVKENVQVQTPSVSETIDSIFNVITNSLQKLDSEQKRFQQFKKLKTYIPPKSYDLGERREYKHVNGVQRLVHVRVNAQFIPLRLVLKLFFELPRVFDETLDYIQDLNEQDEVISNLIQANYWKNRSKTFNDKLVLPVLMYFDDYENNNPLGSHKGIAKSGAVYVSIPSLPIQYQSKIENIFIFILFNTLDRKCFGNSIVFYKAIEELNYLSEVGIELQLADGVKTIFFELTLLVADNLGLHTMLGLTESFKSTIFCQFCLTTHNNKHNVLSEKDCELRTIHNYSNLLEAKNVKLSGMVDECVFHNVASFHMTENICVDVMHDLMEGICRYDIALILNHFINTEGLFSLVELNLSIRSFDYGPKYSINKPPEISERSLKTGYIMMSSSEMLCLIRHLNLIIGPLIPEENDYWSLFLSLRELVVIVSSTTINSNTYKVLDTVVYEYLTSLKELFPDKFKPKHHFLIHYSQCMFKFGPLWKLSCLRFESKNQEGKQISKSTTSRVNINKTIAIRHQLYLNYRFMLKKTTKSLFISKLNEKKKYRVINYLECYGVLKNLDSEKIVIVKYLDYISTRITKKNILIEFSILGPLFHQVHEIIKHESQHFLITKRFEDYCYDEHLQAYKVYNEQNFDWCLLDESVIEASMISCVSKLPDGYNYICKNWI